MSNIYNWISCCVWGTPRDSRWRSHVGKNKLTEEGRTTAAVMAAAANAKHKCLYNVCPWLHPYFFPFSSSNFSTEVQKTNIANSSCRSSAMFVYTKVTFDRERFPVLRVGTLVVDEWNLLVCGVLFCPNHCSPHTIGTKLLNLPAHVVMCRVSHIFNIC